MKYFPSSPWYIAVADTSRNLHSVDRMLAQYREHTEGQAEDMAAVSIVVSDAVIVKNSVPVECFACIHTDGLRYLPTSPLHDYNGSETKIQRRSQSASVRFRDPGEKGLHNLHQSLRDLRKCHAPFQIAAEVLLFLSVENLRLQLVRTEKERADMQQQISHLLSQQRSHSDQLNWPRGLGSGAYTSRYLIVSSCYVMLVWMHSPLPSPQVLSSELERHEQQQLQMLAQLKELQTRFEEERTQAGQNLAQAERSREEGDQRREKLRARAQEALRQWKSRCKALERDLEEKDRDKDKESLQAQLRVLGQQAEGLRRELEEALGRLAQREEELRRRDEELGESQARRKTLEQEVREVSRALQVESERRRLLETQLREENRNLEARADALVHCHEEDQVALLELQGTVKELSTARAGLATRLAEEERAGRQRLEEAQRECISLGQQLQLARELHEKELSSMRAGLQESKARHEENTQLYQQEKEELEAQLEDLKTEAAADRELACAHQRQLERMKAECERLAEEQARSEESHAHLRRKYQLLKQEVEEKVIVARGDGYLRAMDDVVTELREQVGRLEAERQSVLGSAGAEINTLCQFLVHMTMCICTNVLLHCMLQTKLQWLCEEVKERGNREEKLRQHLQQGREQLKVLRKSKDGEQKLLLERLAQQEQLLEDIHGEKRELLERMRRKDEDMQSLQRTKVALEHLESVPEKLSLLENFKDLEECQRQREMVEQRYAKYREIVGVLQHELEESKRRIQEYRVFVCDCFLVCHSSIPLWWALLLWIERNRQSMQMMK
uniref:Centrosomal protein 128 n=1 Tax=Scleropages formosus TaxID=113540 RepID=A0A8C9V9D7_SCLFO